MLCKLWSCEATTSCWSVSARERSADRWAGAAAAEEEAEEEEEEDGGAGGGSTTIASGSMTAVAVSWGGCSGLVSCWRCWRCYGGRAVVAGGVAAALGLVALAAARSAPRAARDAAVRLWLWLAEAPAPWLTPPLNKSQRGPAGASAPCSLC